MPIQLETVYYGAFNASSGGTSGAIGHYYTFTITE
jgi:hypothetical protein